MKKPFILMFFAFVLYFMFSSGTEIVKYAAPVELHVEEISETIANITMTDTIRLVTKNGMTLEKGTLSNNGNMTRNVNFISIGNITSNVSISLAPGEYAQYAAVSGFAIIPQGQSVINEKETSYFPSSEKLSIRLSSARAKNIAVVIPKNMTPLLVRSSSDIKWDLERESNTIIISSVNDDSIGKNTEIYFGKAFQGPMFIEDTENAETLRYRNLNAGVMFGKANATLAAMLENEISLENNITEINVSILAARGNLTVGENAIAEASLKLSEAKIKAATGKEFRPEMLAFMAVLAGTTIYVTFIRRASK
ncbi:MAG: hypothetical protein HY364_01990 [Candidatus Aenigmarchaeota archaeon]|nr:hypothetical protein [Candidatus Aenigmarchaeota archaeon]